MNAPDTSTKSQNSNSLPPGSPILARGVGHHHSHKHNMPKNGGILFRDTPGTSKITTALSSSSMSNDSDRTGSSSPTETNAMPRTLSKKKIRFDDSVFFAERRSRQRTNNDSSPSTTIIDVDASGVRTEPLPYGTSSPEDTSRGNARKMKHNSHGSPYSSSSSLRKRSARHSRRHRSHHPYTSSSSSSEHGRASFGSTSKYSSRGIPLSDINESDVLCEGPGKGVIIDATNPGNQRFQALLDLKSRSFRHSSKREKLKIAHLAATLVHESIPSGRFLIMNPDSGLWHEIKKDKAWSKALRSFVLHRSASNSKNNDHKTFTKPRPSSSDSRTSVTDGKVSVPTGVHSDMIHVNDVLCGGPGQGVLATTNPGNLRFQTLVDSKLAAFRQASKQEKLNMAHLASLLVHEALPRGRFLVLADTGNWHEVPQEKAWSKVLRTFFARLPQEERGGGIEEGFVDGMGSSSPTRSSTTDSGKSHHSSTTSSSKNCYYDKQSYDFRSIVAEYSLSRVMQGGEQRPQQQQEKLTTS
mmetsp:Transcript_8241/g.12630  ORF Transcript_8241/g.12630 Transcript_8241/m.12630 type:complete len:526 (+) Transcript_8241:306-1883(+)